MIRMHRMAAVLALCSTVSGGAAAQGQLGSVQAYSQELNTFLANPPQGLDVQSLLQDSLVVPQGLVNGAGFAWNDNSGGFDFFHDNRRVTDTRLQIPPDLNHGGKIKISDFADTKITAGSFSTLVQDMEIAAHFARAAGNDDRAILPAFSPSNHALMTLDAQVLQTYGEGFSARPLSFAAEIDGKRVKMFELSMNGAPVAIQYGNDFYGNPLGGPGGLPTILPGSLGYPTRALPAGCGVTRDCVRRLKDLVGFAEKNRRLKVTIRRNCNWTITKATGNCVLSAIGLAHIINPAKPAPDFIGSAMMIDQRGQFALTAHHVETKGHLVSNGDRAFGVSYQLHEAAYLPVAIDELSYKKTGEIDGIFIDLGLFQFETPFDHDQTSDAAVIAHPILHSDQMGAIHAGLPLVGVGFGKNSEVSGFDGTGGIRRSGLASVIDCSEAPVAFFERCVSGYYFVAKANPSERDAITTAAGPIQLNANQACTEDSGSPAYVKMQDDTLAIIGLLVSIGNSTFCDDFELFVNLTHPKVQAWISQQLIATGVSKAEASARVLTPKGAIPTRVPFAVVLGHGHTRN